MAMPPRTQGRPLQFRFPWMEPPGRGRVVVWGAAIRRPARSNPVQAIVRAKQDAGPAADYPRFHAAVAHAQLTGWLPADSSFLIDISGPGARSAEVAACAGHSVLRVLDAVCERDRKDRDPIAPANRPSPGGTPPRTPRTGTPAPTSCETSGYETSGRLSTVTADGNGLEFLPDECADGV